MFRFLLVSGFLISRFLVPILFYQFYSKQAKNLFSYFIFNYIVIAVSGGLSALQDCE